MYLIIIFLIILLSCTPPQYFLDKDNIISSSKSVELVKGYGKISGRINGENLSGSFDMHFQTDSFLNLTFYSGFGTIVGFIKTNKDSVKINFGGKEKNISLFENLDVENYLFLPNLNILEIGKIFSGEIINELTQEKPLEIIEKGNRIFYRWLKNNIDYTATFSKKRGGIRNFTIEYLYDNKKIIIQLKKFYNNFPIFLSFYVDGQNYFYLNYEKIKRIIK